MPTSCDDWWEEDDEDELGFLPGWMGVNEEVDEGVLLDHWGHPILPTPFPTGFRSSRTP